MKQGIDYGNLMHRAMRGLIREVLEGVAQHGLPGAHHFFITFDTTHPDSELADWLSDRYPEEMTVVLQHWYDALAVDAEGFSVVLNFGDRPEPLYVPFDAIRTFVDPSVEFGLRFETATTEEEEEDAAGDAGEKDAERAKAPADAADAAPRNGAEVVSLDKFRK